ncbi:MAG: SusC/RagA family TonB-linked outer membrane protein [Gemmatimonadaceae bacterium]
MPATRVRGVAVRVGVVAAALLVTAVASAQDAVISGRVTNEQGAPLQGANVFIQTLGLGTAAGPDGNYRLTVPDAQATGQQVSLGVRFIGYRPQARPITLSAGSQEQSFQLAADPFKLTEVVVTGVAAATERNKLTISADQVTADQIDEVPASSPIAALAGKVSGARVMTGVGNPGATPSIRLRGSTSLRVGVDCPVGGCNQPLIIVDGVITRNSISDLDANDIESIEVLKGAAAASFYGSQAANGVINITTKRGRNASEQLQVTLRSEIGQSGVQRYVPLNTSHYYLLNPDGTIALTAGGTRIVDPNRIADNPFPSDGPNRFRNQLEEWLGDGTFYSSNIQLGMRRGNTNFASSFTVDRNEGIVPLTRGLDRQNVRVNVDQGVGSKADLSLSVTYGVQKNDYNPAGSESWFALMQAPPDVNLQFPSPTGTEYHRDIPDVFATNARDNPLYSLANAQFRQRRERILGSFSARYRPWDFLRLEASYGTDRLNRLDTYYEFRGYQNEGGGPGPGELERDTRNNVGDNMQVSATATHSFFDQLHSTTRAAYLLENGRTSFFTATGSRLVVSDVPDLAALDPEQLAINSTDTHQRTINYMVNQSLDFRDRYLVDVLYRRDGSSLFGADERWQDFYRISGAYRISEDFQIPGIQELKIRAARGTAGLRPQFADQYETYTITSGTFSKQQVGNKKLKPAIQTEDEFGLHVAFLDRFDIEAVYAKRFTEGAFLNVPVSPAQTGGFREQVQNAADVAANTWELALNTRVVDRPDFSYSFTLTGDRTRQKIERMVRAPFRVNAGGQGQDVFYYKAGEPLGIIYGARWVRSFAELMENPANASAVESDFVVNPLGFLVRRSARGMPGEVPIAYVNAARETQHKIGNVNPDFAFGLANNIRFKGFNVYALFDGQQGGDIYNFTKQWMFQDFRHGSQDQSGVPEDQRIALPFFSSGLYNGLVANDYFVEDGSYVKLRELSASYTFGRDMLARIGADRYANAVKVALIGRNLYTWTDYSGFDPEVTSGNDFNFRIDGFRYPNFRTITGQVEIQF